MTLNTRTTHTQKPALETVVWCCWPMYSVTWYLYPYYDKENTGLYNWKYTWNQTGKNNSIKSSNKHQHGHTNFWYVCLLEFISITKNAAIMCGMHIINGVHGPEPRSSGGNTSSNQQVAALIPRSAFNRMERMCQCHGSNQNSHPHVLVQRPLCNQFIHNRISSRGVLGINHFKRRNFAAVAIQCFLRQLIEAV